MAAGSVPPGANPVIVSLISVYVVTDTPSPTSTGGQSPAASG